MNIHTFGITIHRKEKCKDTYYWNEVKSDPNYADIKNNDDLVLSEIHSRICGKMADAVLGRIAETDGKITKDKAIDWDKKEIGNLSTSNNDTLTRSQSLNL